MEPEEKKDALKEGELVTMKDLYGVTEVEKYTFIISAKISDQELEKLNEDEIYNMFREANAIVSIAKGKDLFGEPESVTFKIKPYDKSGELSPDIDVENSFPSKKNPIVFFSCVRILEGKLITKLKIPKEY